MIQANATIFDSVLCFGDSDWWYHNRGHADMQFMRRFAARWPVLYVNSLGVKMPSAGEGKMFLRRVARKCKSMSRFLRDGGEGFHVMTPVYAPMNAGFLGRTMRGSLAMQIRTALRLRGMHRPLVWVACPTAAVVLESLPVAGIVHQLSDCYAALNAGWSELSVQREGEVAQSADLIICASGRLMDWARQRYGQGEYVDHGVDFDRFDAAVQERQTPDELRDVGAPIVGFFGNMDDNTVDRALLEAVICARPAYRFALVGPMAANFESLKALPNVIAVPQQPYERIPHYGAAFDVCLMPWLRNDWIAHCNPVKLKEYLALGKPIVSTPFPELERFADVCYAATGADAFAAAIDRALTEDDDTKRAARRARAASQTWDAKFERVLELLGAKGIVGHA